MQSVLLQAYDWLDWRVCQGYFQLLSKGGPSVSIEEPKKGIHGAFLDWPTAHSGQGIMPVRVVVLCVRPLWLSLAAVRPACCEVGAPQACLESWGHC
eukprot:4364357-Amphidinium_carterae.2